MRLIPLRPRPWDELTVLYLEGTDYEFSWTTVPILDGPTVVRWHPQVNTASVYDHKHRQRISWEEFQERTLAFYDADRVAGLIYSKETEWDPT